MSIARITLHINTYKHIQKPINNRADMKKTQTKC